MMVQFGVSLMVSIIVVCCLVLFTQLYNYLAVKPRRLRAIMRKQGIDGPPPTLLLGNISQIKEAQSKLQANPQPTSHNCASLLFPFFDLWRQKYGQVFVFSLGHVQILYVNDPEVVRHFSSGTSSDLGRPSYLHKEQGPLLGQGILTSNGAVWAHQRKIIAPEFYIDKVKGMVNLIIESAMILLNLWTSRIETEGGIADIQINQYMRRFSGDVISRVCFGSNYSTGEKIFLKLRALQEVISKTTLITGIPGIRYIPTKSNREAWALEKEVRSLILEVVKERREKATTCHKDLLQMVIEGASELGQEATDRFIVDNCKNTYLGGYATTAVSACWCLMLLASNQDWQDRVRAEVLQVCQGGTPDVDKLRKMKQLNMVIHEALRLYPPLTIIAREALKDMKFRDIKVPKGVNVWTVILTLHTDPEIWGQDSYMFKPERFENGIAGACKFPHLYMPFGVGPRVCLAQNLAMVELKTLIALILSNFSVAVSPKYRHSPVFRFVMEPEYDVDLLVRKL